MLFGYWNIDNPTVLSLPDPSRMTPIPLVEAPPLLGYMPRFSCLMLPVMLDQPRLALIHLGHNNSPVLALEGEETINMLSTICNELVFQKHFKDRAPKHRIAW